MDLLEDVPESAVRRWTWVIRAGDRIRTCILSELTEGFQMTAPAGSPTVSVCRFHHTRMRWSLPTVKPTPYLLGLSNSEALHCSRAVTDH